MKLKSLEGLRGIAAFIVVIFHFFTNFYPALVNAYPLQVHTSSGIELKIAVSPLNVLYNGSFSVNIFFVLSGFVLSYKFFRTGDNQVITSSAIRRYFRLMIPVLFSVICFYVFYTMKLPGVINNIPDFSFLHAFREGLYACFFNVQNSYSGVLWTMHFEFFGSFLVFGFCLIFGKSRNRIWCYILVLALFWDTSYLPFILGMLISDAKNNLNITINSKIAKIILFFVALFLGSYPNVVGTVPGTIGIDDTIYFFLHFTDNAATIVQSLGAALLLIVLITSVKFTNFLSKSFFQFLGRISFSMYLTHGLAITFFSHRFFEHLNVNMAMQYKFSFIITLSVSLIIIFFIAYLTERYVDRTAVNFSMFIYKRFFFSDIKSAAITGPSRTINN